MWLENPAQRLWLPNASPANYPVYPGSHAGHMAMQCVCPSYGGRARCDECRQIVCKDCGGEANV